MPRLTRWMIKTSLVYLVLALLTGVALGLRSALALDWLPAGLTPVYFHLYMVGWVTMLIFGVVYWMFPKYSLEKPRGRERLGWWVYGLLNVGLALRVLGESLAQPGNSLGWALVVSAALQWLAGAGFVLNTWQRVKEK